MPSRDERGGVAVGRADGRLDVKAWFFEQGLRGDEAYTVSRKQLRKRGFDIEHAPEPGEGVPLIPLPTDG